MWIFFKRLLNIGKVKAHDKLDKIEDPVALTEQSIKDLKQDLSESMKSLAEMKALAIRTKRDLQQQERVAGQYEQRAVKFIQKAENGDMSMEDADRAALKLLSQKDQVIRVSSANKQNLQAYENMIRKLELDVQRIRTQINTWEGELKTLKVRSRLSETSRRLNERMSSMSKNSMSNMLEDMKTKVEEQEALAQSYQDLANNEGGIDKEVDNILGKSATSLPDMPSPQESLAELKAKMKALPKKTTEQLEEEALGKDEDKGENDVQNNYTAPNPRPNIIFRKTEESSNPPKKRPRLRIRKNDIDE